MRPNTFLRISRIGVLACVLMCLGFTGCGGDGTAPTDGSGRDPSSRVSPTDVDERLVSANTRFAFHLFSELVGDGVEENLFVSPPSIAFALTMTLNGADAETYEAMAEALEISDLTLEEINEANAVLMAWLEQADPKVQLFIANSLWAREGIPFRQEFMEVNTEYYGAEVTNLNFRDPRAVDVINGWVNEATREKIPTIIDRIPPEAILYIINAIYFKGLWTEPFDEADTREEPFTLPNGSEVIHPLMHQTEYYRYLEDPGFQAVSLPYGEDGRFSMYVFLPDEASSLDEFLGKLSSETWEDWMSRFRSMKGSLGFPKLEVEYETLLNEVLSDLGMGVAFDPGGADFSRMYRVSAFQNVYIDRVKHKTYVKVDEEGTEAAAVTSVGIGITSGPTEFFHMIVDRPFFFAIRDNETGTILFMGTVVDPT